MSEVMRFRIARQPQRTVTTSDDFFTLPTTPFLKTLGEVYKRAEGQALIAPPRLFGRLVGRSPGRSRQLPLLLPPGGVVRAYATSWLSGAGLAPPARSYATDDPRLAAVLAQVQKLDAALAVSPTVVARDLNKFFGDQLDGAPAQVFRRWVPLLEALTDTLIASVVTDATPELRGNVVRLLLVIGFTEMAARGEKPDVEQALHWRTVQLPDQLLYVIPSHSILARQPAVDDLYVVREEWARYELGELAHVETALKGELRERVHERTDETEITTTIEEETSRTTERDTQTTDRFQLNTEAQKDVSLSAHVAASVDSSGQYGPTHVDTHLGGSLDYSVEDAEKRATQQASETISRVVTRIENRVRRQRVERTLTRIFERNTHRYDNTRGEDNLNGLYRWIDKIQTVQMFRYPHRLIFEFYLPEPGAMVRWQAVRPPKLRKPSPPPFTLDGTEQGAPLLFSHIATTDDDKAMVAYQVLASRYASRGIKLPPQDQRIAVQVKAAEVETDVANANKPPSYATTTVQIPDGWQAKQVRILAIATNGVFPEDPPPRSTGWIEIAIGTWFPSSSGNQNDPNTITRFQGTNIFRGVATFELQEKLTGTVPILLATDDTLGLGCTVELLCEPTSAKWDEWRIGVYDQVLSDYWTMRRDYEQERDQAQLQRDVDIRGNSPQRNRQVIAEEIKRLTIEQLLGVRFKGRPALSDEVLDDAQAATTGPFVDLDRARGDAAEVEFLEQTFEWETLDYALYPSYWAASKEWALLASIGTADDDYDRFLRAGAARVVLPARPGFERQACLYTRFGILWGGGSVPMPGTDYYVSLAAEIRTQQLAPSDGEPGKWWEVRLPTTLVALEPVGTRLPLDHVKATLPQEIEGRIGEPSSKPAPKP